MQICYTKARGALQRLRRQEENFSTIKHNTSLMHLNQKNHSGIFALMKRYHGSHYKTTMTSVLHTPVGTYHDEDVLKGFAADAEHLGRPNEENGIFDQGFYKLCKLDNCYIFEIISSEPLKLPPMTIGDLGHILHKRMKMGKACDIYQVTVEHLRYCGDTTKLHILQNPPRYILPILSSNKTWCWICDPQGKKQTCFQIQLLEKNYGHTHPRSHN